MTRYFVRFTPSQRVEHAAAMVVFVLLCVTGLPQKYYESDWAAPLLLAMGGIDAARWLHRAAGLVFSGMLVLHVSRLLWGLTRGTTPVTMAPHRKDVTDAITTLRYYAGLSDQQARFDRFDYKQKFEYWGMLLGSFVVVSTGLILLYPIEITRWLPGSLIPVAVVAHSNEGLLAFLTIVTWHIFNACLTPEVFPVDTTIFTGRISEERLHHEHPLEYERLIAQETGGAPKPHQAA
jgi:cytochrome b subunit of formate dehydrogenase